MKKQILIIAAIAISNSLLAQKDSLNAVIQVENEYNPVVVKANKKNFTPRIETESENKPLDLIFSQEATPYSQFVSERNTNSLLPQQESQLPGYARLGYGNNNNIDIMAGYHFDISEKDKVRLLASMNGYSANIDGVIDDWDSRFFTTWISADYTHRFDNLSVGVETNINNKVFNYLQLLPDVTDKQNSGSYNIAVKAASETTGPLSYKANIGYTLNTRKYSAGLKERMSENHFNANGTVTYEFTDEKIRNIGANVAIDGFTYSDALNHNGSKYDNFALIRLNPFVNMRYNEWKVQLGLHLDMQTTGGAFIAIAPDCNIEGQISDKISLFASVTGGRTLNTFAGIEQLSPYWENIGQYTSTYKVADVTAGTRLTLEPVKASMYVGYAYIKDDMLATYYPDCNLYNIFVQATSRNYYIGGKFNYDHEGWLSTTADIRYDSWNCSGHSMMLLYKPSMTIDLNAEARIIEGLFANAGYTFTRYTKDDGYRIKNKNNLTAKIRYKFHEQFEAFLSGNNLLSSKYEAFPGYIAQGANVIAGVSVRF